MKDCYIFGFNEFRCKDFTCIEECNIAFKINSDTTTIVSLKWSSAGQVIATQTSKMNKNEKEHPLSMKQCMAT